MKKYHDVTPSLLITTLLQQSKKKLNIILAQSGADQHELAEREHSRILDPETGVELWRGADMFEEGCEAGQVPWSCHYLPF